MASILKTECLSKVYKQGEIEVHALRNISLNIQKGETVSIIGKSGSGKSTLLHILGFLDSPTEGKIYINEKEVTNTKEKEKCKIRKNNIGFVFQFFNLIPELNALENIKFPSMLKSKRIDIDYINELISILHLNDRINHLPEQLSGGQKQRVAIARALSGKPEIVLCDEPTGNLDESTGSEVIKMLFEAQKKYNQTLVIVTHDTDLANLTQKKIELINGHIQNTLEK